MEVDRKNEKGVVNNSEVCVYISGGGRTSGDVRVNVRP